MKPVSRSPANATPPAAGDAPEAAAVNLGRKRGRRPGSMGLLYREIADRLRDELRRGRYLPGQRLPGNDELAQRLDVNRLTLRRALLGLIKEGLLVARPSRGTFVADPAGAPAAADAAPEAEAEADADADSALRVAALISTVYSPEMPNVYHLEFLNAIRGELLAVGCALVIPRGHDAAYPSASTLVPDVAADGLVFLGPCSDDVLMRAARDGRPVVLIDADAGPAPVDSVVVDNVAAGRLAAEHLRELGHTNVAVVTGYLTQPAVVNRLAGFRAAWAAHGGTDDGLTVANGRYQKTVTRALVETLLRERPGITGVFCFNDDMAAGALQAVGARGRDDVAVVGCDDVAFATMLNPTLSTVRIPRAAMARLAVRRLLGWRAARRDGVPFARHTVSPTLVVRESSYNRKR